MIRVQSKRKGWLYIYEELTIVAHWLGIKDEIWSRTGGLSWAARRRSIDNRWVHPLSVALPLHNKMHLQWYPLLHNACLWNSLFVHRQLRQRSFFFFFFFLFSFFAFFLALQQWLARHAVLPPRRRPVNCSLFRYGKRDECVMPGVYTCSKQERRPNDLSSLNNWGVWHCCQEWSHACIF